MNPFQSQLLHIQTPATQEKNVQRACLFTLIVIATDLDKAARCQQLVQIISKKFPCKIIFVALNSFHSEKTLLINRSLMTTTNGGGPISCDLLTLEASFDEVAKIPFLLLPEIVPDLPTFLLTSEAPFDLPVAFNMLKEYINHAIFEINSIENYSSIAQSLLNFCKQTNIIDLHWVRIQPWRMTLSRIFHSEKKSEALQNIARIEIRYIKRSFHHRLHTKTQAMLLQAWLASRLGWQTESVDVQGEKITISYKNKESSFILELLSTESHFLEEGMVSSIELTTLDEIHYLLAYEADDRHIVVHSSSKDRCAIPYSFFVNTLQKGTTLPTELFQSKTSVHYMQVLQHLSDAQWAKIGTKENSIT